MYKASQEVIKNGGSAGIDNIDIPEFNKNYKTYMRELYRQFKEDRYTPKPVLRVFIPKDDGRKRPLGIPTVKDRIAQATLKRILEPIFEKVFCDCSYGFRPGRSQIDAGVMTEGSLVPTEQGTPQGGVISPLLANIFLHQFDKKMTKRGYKVVRFADDFVIMTKSKRKAKRAYEVVKEIIEGKLDLTLHPDKTVVTNFGKGFVFLGFEFIAWRYKRPRKKAS